MEAGRREITREAAVVRQLSKGTEEAQIMQQDIISGTGSRTRLADG